MGMCSKSWVGKCPKRLREKVGWKYLGEWCSKSCVGESSKGLRENRWVGRIVSECIPRVGVGKCPQCLREKRLVERLGWGRVPRAGWGNVPTVCVRNVGWKDLGGNVFQRLGGEMFQGFA